MLLLSEAEVERLITPDLAIATAEAAFVAQSSGKAGTPARADWRQESPRFGTLVLVGTAGGPRCVVKSNMHAYPPGGGPRRAASLLTLWDMAACRPVALLASAGFNNHRTAAGFAAAAKVLARPDASTLAVFGAGKIAPAAIRYLAAVRPIRRVILIGKGGARAGALASAIPSWPGFEGVRAEAGLSAAAAVAEADVVLTVTTADSPVFPGTALRPGALVILGGSNRPSAREGDDSMLARASVWADHLEGALGKAGDLRLPLAAGTLDAARLRGDIGHLIEGGASPPGDDVRVFKSIGIAPQDVLLAEAILTRAEAGGIERRVDLLDGLVEPEHVDA